ncbi:beta-lactamase family protein [Antarcticibacterium sp. 1MA-6-2]|uniref:serine hydrolase domain-containing protein n=1 Tax=Antarcticibacterium sp. 1MA-6-2 TaxID=2908210 RepID=UPI001F308F23|nr:serine hydrolase domain-containing protein [Antarcticibacterium sp. 1MA-6-2]UJH90133.1 beta-lactamase family protein [Antarcticibacterium sp. 1MA-6-2]
MREFTIRANIRGIISTWQDLALSLLKELSAKENTIIAFFKNPYLLNQIDEIEAAPGLILTYQDNLNSEDLAAQLIFGGVGANGKLPVTVGEKFKAGAGLELEGGLRFKYTLPEEAGMDSKILGTKINSLMQEAINARAIPGGQVLVAKDQKVIFHKAYGHHSYTDTIKVKLTDLYDLASITKVTSALPALMKLRDEGKFDLEAGIDTYLPKFRRSNKSGISFREILAHQAGFQAWIPYWRNTIRRNGSYKWNTFKKDSSARYPIKVAEDMWLHRNYKKKIYREIKKSLSE